eukprot:12530600-Alexandrium_andersonii.AAC.1
MARDVGCTGASGGSLARQLLKSLSVAIFNGVNLAKGFVQERAVSIATPTAPACMALPMSFRAAE